MSLLKHKPRVIYDESGAPDSVILDYADFVAMIEELEDQIDSRIFDVRLRNAGKPRPLTEILAELEEAGK